MYSNGTETLNHTALQNRLGMSFPRHSPPPGWEIATTTAGTPTLSQLLAGQRNQVRLEAAEAYAEPVTDANGITWAGGFDSGLRANMGAELGDYTGKPQITLYDADDNEHVLSPGQVKQVAATIGAAYQQKLAAEKAALRALKAIDLTASDAKAQIEAVRFGDYYSLG